MKKCGSDSGYFSKAHGNCFVRLNENMYWPVLYSRDELASTFLSQLDTVFHELNHFEQILKMKSDKYVSYNNYRMAQEEITTSDTIYEDNYWNMLLEMESRLAGKRRVEELIKSLGETMDELKEVEATYPGSASYIYEFLYDENEIRFKQEKEMIKNLKEQNLFFGTENDKFIDQNLEQILESKYKRRFEMLEMYQDGRYEEGYELINYNLQKGVDVPLREDNVSDVENNIRHLFVREKFIDVYNKTESEIDFKNREFNEDVKISYVLNAVATGKIPSRLFHRIARTFPRFTRNNFKELAAVFKVAEDLTLPGEKNYVTELYNIPDVQKIVEKMFESDVYKEIVEESKLSLQPERKTQLDLDYEIADEYLRHLESPEDELSEFVTNDIPTIGENVPEADKVMWKITTIQKGYLVSVEDGDWARSREPVYLKSRRDLIMEDAVREAIRRNVSFNQVQGVNFKEEQTQNKEGVDQDD